MQAKVKADYRWPAVVAFGGHEYVKTEFRPVPAGCEAEAQRHPYIETAQDPGRVELRFAGTIQDGEIAVIESTPPEVGDPLQPAQAPAGKRAGRGGK